MSTQYWWCWLGIAVNLAYILLLNGIIILCLALLPAYGSTATIAKTAEELEDRRAALYGDARNADDVVINLPAYGASVGENVSGNAEPMIQVGRPGPALSANSVRPSHCLSLPSVRLPVWLAGWLAGRLALSICLPACMFVELSGNFLCSAICNTLHEAYRQ